MSDRKRRIERFKKACSLRGKAWLAVNAFCVNVLGEKYIDAHDDEYRSPGFYPPGIIAAAMVRLNELFHQAGQGAG